ncbi:hypothetical protein [Bradyrhizobium erythrophlei]|jgi:hypothetical protein|uniref:Uncharacterized protein n=1 Tax=Bradyrhizobium erythrophlei TaxID=1437360 RepID=A0A1M5LX24_9BRAD|nr:hypothetical protein [Bradyrhizobium erythrophlei]SHG69682.1 hypothetical protein SAMN05444169_3711 [Bradyrhizobium erythrophlei]
MVETWPTRIVAGAAGMKQRALSQCFALGALKLCGADKRPSGSGSRVGLSRPRAYQAAAMKQLHRNGLSIPHAARVAFEFSDVGNINRAPGELFAHGTTHLVVTPDGATVKNCFADTSISEISNSACVIIVNCNQIVQQVDAVLNNERSYD